MFPPRPLGPRPGVSPRTRSPASVGGHAPGHVVPAAAVTVRTAGDVPASVAVGPCLFDLTIGLHISDTKASSDVIQACYRGGTLAVDGDSSPRWLVYVQAARDRHEQTVEAVRDPRGYIFYRTLRPLREGEELLVWYGDELARECGIPVLTPDNIRGDQQYVCTNCGKSYKHPNCLKAHIRFRCAQTRLDLLVSARASGSWFRFHPRPTGPRLDRTSSPDTFLHSTCTGGPLNLKIGEGSAFKPHRRSSESRKSPCSVKVPDRLLEKQKRAKSLPSSSADRLDAPSPSKAVSLTEPPHKWSTRSDTPTRLSPPFQIFSHMHAPSYPIPVENAALNCYYGSLYGRLNGSPTGQYCCNRVLSQPCLPNGYLHSPVYPYGLPKVMSSPDQEHHLDGALKGPAPAQASMEGSPEGACLPFSFPLPSEKAGEPLDLLPRSLYMHKSRKGHLCIYCGKLYSRKYGLKIHLRTHTGYKPLKCKVCLRPFGDPSNLNKHIRLHAEGDTPYRCEYCGKVLVRRRDLERHIKSRHPNEAAKLAGEGDTAGEFPSPLGMDLTEESSAVNCADSSAESLASVESGAAEDHNDIDFCNVDDDDDEEDDEMCEIEVVS